MGGIPRQAEAFAVVGDEFNSHDSCSFLLMGEYRKPPCPEWEHDGFVKNDRQVNLCV